MSDRSRSLAGLLWLRAGEHDLSLPLAQVRRVVLGRQLRVVTARSRAVPAWWSGATIIEGRPHSLVSVSALLGEEKRAKVAETVVVLTSLGREPVGLVCDRFRGIIPAGLREWRVPTALFATNDCVLPHARLWQGRLVLDFETDRLVGTKRRTQLDQAMKNSKENVDLLWELSDLEAQLAAAPTARGYEELAARYRKLGWTDDAERLLARAAEVKSVAPAPKPATGGLSGAMTPRILLELLYVLQTTGKSGDLLIDAPGAIAGTITFNRGVIVDVKSADADDAPRALRKIAAIRAGRYQFFPGAPVDGERKPVVEVSLVLADLERSLNPQS